MGIALWQYFLYRLAQMCALPEHVACCGTFASQCQVRLRYFYVSPTFALP